VRALLSRPRGATIAAMMQATGWQAHTVRGFLAGVVRKKLGLTLQSDKTEGERIDRVVRTGEGTQGICKPASAGPLDRRFDVAVAGRVPGMIAPRQNQQLCGVNDYAEPAAAFHCRPRVSRRSHSA
jgi:Protein of unknown function (DUF3489)